MPDLTGVPVSQVEARLREHGFTSSTGVPEEGNGETECKVHEQSPKPGAKVDRDTTITYHYIDGFPFRDCMEG